MRIQIIVILFLVLRALTVYAQDSLMQFELIKNVVFIPKIITNINQSEDIKQTKNRYGSQLIVSKPVYRDLCVSSGILFSIFQERYRNEHFNYSNVTLFSPVYINYNILKKNRTSMLISGGIDYKLWQSEYIEEITHISTKRTFKQGFTPFNIENVSINVSYSMKYYFIKRFGLMLKYHVVYNFFDGRSSFNSGLGFGICYK